MNHSSLQTPTPSARSAIDVLDVEGLERSFGDLQAVRDVSFHIASGETYGLLGPNGAGKTTTISMIAGILKRHAGEVRIDGEPVSSSTTEARSAIGLVPQELALYPDLTAVENLRFFGTLYGMAKSELDERVRTVLDVIGLADRAKDKAGEFSGGMQRRLNIGIGLLHRPRLLILDEPTVGVDPQSRNAILESVEALSAEGMAVLYTTHYMEEAERLCDRVGIIDEGEIKAEGTRRELVALVGEHDQVVLTVTGDPSAASRIVENVDGVETVSVDDKGIRIVTESAAGVLPGILSTLAASDMTVSGIEIEEPNLEAVFLHLTGKALRD